MLVLIGILSMSHNSSSDQITIMTNGIDHIIYASTTLEQGIEDIECILGIRPVPGGHHPQYGTHNALLSLGSGIYLEVIARDPQLPTPLRGALIDIPPTGRSGLVTWVYRTNNIIDLSEKAKHTELGLGSIESGSRTMPDGNEIRWQLTDPYAMPMNGAIPFLIDWGDTSHPSVSIPYGGKLVEFVIKHPEADRVRNALFLLGSNVSVINSDQSGFIAKIFTMTGLVILE